MLITKANSRINLTLDRPYRSILKRTGLVPGFNEGAGFDLRLVLKSRPEHNYIDFNYDAHLANAFHQPELTSLEKVNHIRPDHVINSIAFFDPTRDYKPKIGHLYRMKANGHWCDWTVEKFGRLRLWLDEALLKTAKYPLYIYPVADTFGYTTAGASASTLVTNSIVGTWPWYPNHSGIVVSMEFYGNTSANGTNAQMAIYSNNQITGIRQANTVSVPCTTTPQWWTANVTVGGQIAAGSNYVLCLSFDASYAYQYYDLASGYGIITQLGTTFGTWPTSILWFFYRTDTAAYSIYANYTSVLDDIKKQNDGRWVGVR